MNRIFIALLLSQLAVPASHAGLRVVGYGERVQLDASGFPSDMQAAYQLMQTKCVKCHTMERTVIALQSGIAPITGVVFDKNAARAYGIKMVRKPDANISQQQARSIIDLLCYLIDESAKK